MRCKPLNLIYTGTEWHPVNGHLIRLGIPVNGHLNGKRHQINKILAGGFL